MENDKIDKEEPKSKKCFSRKKSVCDYWFFFFEEEKHLLNQFDKFSNKNKQFIKIKYIKSKDIN